jgi:hypothetical protein
MKKLRHLGNLSRFAIGASLASSLFACSALLGLTDPALDNSVSDGDASSGGDSISATDSPVVKTDGGSEASTDCDAAFATDPLNCGSCGHSCLGGACLGNQCQPVVVDDDSTNTDPYDLGIIIDKLYFTNNAPPGVRYIGKTEIKKGIGDSFQIQTFSGGTKPFEIAVSTTNVFFSVYGGTTNGGRIERCTTVDCSSPVNLSGFDSYTVATDGTNVVYGETFTPPDGGAATYTVRKTTTALAAGSVLMTFPAEVFWLRIAGGVVYVGVDDFDDNGGLFSCPLTGCPGSGPKQLSSIEAEEFNIVNDTVYFTNAINEIGDNLNTVNSVKTDGSNLTTIADKLGNPFSVVADSTYVYFSDTGDIDMGGTGKLLRCPVAGCGTNNALAVDFGQGGNPQGIVDDGNAIYWGDYNGKIYKLAK